MPSSCAPIGLAVTFTILIVTANTMSMAVRDRQTEIAVLKTLGFTRRLVMGLVLGEALALGILLSRVAIRALPKLPFVGDAVAGFPNLGLTGLRVETVLPPQSLGEIVRPSRLLRRGRVIADASRSGWRGDASTKPASERGMPLKDSGPRGP